MLVSIYNITIICKIEDQNRYHAAGLHHLTQSCHFKELRVINACF